MANYKFLTGPFAGEVVEEGMAILDVPWKDLDEDMQDRILDWHRMDEPVGNMQAQMEKYENAWDSEETEELATLKPLSEI